MTLTRLLRGQSPAQGGTDHTSHRLIAYGLTERQAVLVLYGVALISGLAAASLEALNYDLSLILVPAVLIAFSLLVGYLARLKVVAAPSKVDGGGNNGGITRLMGELTYKRRVFEIVLDLMLIGFSYYLAFWTRYGLDMTEISMGLFLKSWPLALGAAYLAFYLFGVYRGVWRYIGFSDLVRYVGAALAAGGLAGLAARVVYPGEPYTLDVFILFAVFLLLGLAGTRSSFQILDRMYGRQQGKAERMPVLLYGAEDAGELALRWIMRSPELGYLPAGFLDEDPYKWGRSIHGVDVLGGTARLEDILGSHKVAGVVVTTGELLGSEHGKQLLAICHQQGVWVRVMRLEFELKQ